MPDELIIASFWRQGEEMRDEIKAALREFRDQMTDIEDGRQAAN